MKTISLIRSLQPPANGRSSFANFSILKIEAILSSETSVHTRSTRRHTPEDGILVTVTFGEEYEKQILEILCRVTLIVGVYKTRLKTLSHK
jgi:hypothetical protein